MRVYQYTPIGGLFVLAVTTRCLYECFLYSFWVYPMMSHDLSMPGQIRDNGTYETSSLIDENLPWPYMKTAPG